MQTASTAVPTRIRASRFFLAFSSLRHATISVVLHLIIVIVFGSVAIYRVQEQVPEFIAGGGELLADTTQLPTPPTTPPEVPKEYQPSISSPQSSMQSSTALDSITTSAASNFSVNSNPVTSTLGNLAALASTGNGSDIAKMATAGIGRTGASTMRFMGTQAKGQSVVFVVDVSGSMIRGGTKSEKTYEVLEKEVATFIRSLDLKCTFGLVVFSQDARTYRSELVRATSDEKQRAISWLKKHSPTTINDPKAKEEERKFHHGTRADRGLAEAFAMQPEVIFFISDGEPTGAKPAEILSQVSQAQAERPSPASVNSVAYLADGGQRFMKDLAEKNQGLFREVNPSDVK